jgi:hypothetical protein
MRIGPLTRLPASYLLRSTTTAFNRPAEERSSIDARMVSDGIPPNLPEGASGAAISVSTGGDSGNAAVGGLCSGVMTAGLPE